MIIDYLTGAVSGLAAGFAFYKLAIMQIAKRTQDTQKQNALKKPVVIVLWLFLSVLLFTAVVWRGKGLFNAKSIEYLILIPILLNISAVDFLIRKVPNELLLLTLVVKIVFIAIALFNQQDLEDSLISPVIGLAVGFLLFSIPSLFKVYIGAGDVKLSAVIGFCLGYYLYLQAMILMSVILFVYLIFLLITKKGNVKTLTSMGPFLAFGAILTFLFPITEIIPR